MAAVAPGHGGEGEGFGFGVVDFAAEAAPTGSRAYRGFSRISAPFGASVSR